MGDTATLRRQLKIKTGVILRLKKENELYQKEAVDLQVKKDKMVAENGDEWEIKNAASISLQRGKMQEETAKMITDSKERLARSFGELRDLVMLAKKEPELVEEDEFLKAEEALEEAAL
ncbi:unnamed protein product [Mycena citricolor]|uniref:Tubulin-specific chaperone A n=1 Tax=Mycena citricolor TaxID=2018698 RepID=A0AAD2GY68_9AGAR|nr:unnamed protein product [Mycena citricolor]